MTQETSRRYGLSKSKVTSFEQCPKKLWLGTHRRDEAIQDAGSHARFVAGDEVGDLACRLSPGGLMVEAVPDLKAALSTTSDLIASGHRAPIYEATFERDGVLIRLDIMEPLAGGAWHIAEVKSSTGVKDYHLGDLATQLWVMEKQAITVSSACIRHIDNSFVLAREGDYRGLFKDVILHDKLGTLVSTRGKVVEAARATLVGAEPDIEMGDHCRKPFECEFQHYCASEQEDLPEWPVTDLPRGAGKKWAVLGVTNLLELDEADLGSVPARILAATRDDEPYHDLTGARDEMKDWHYPRVWLDFETIAFAIPRWVGTRAYQQIPFQFSAHIEHKDGSIEHSSFLDLTGKDPRRAIAEALMDCIEPGACVIAYNAGFERSVLRNLALGVPQYAKRLEAMADATVDLLPVTRNNWYHRDQRGSWSIKAVLPTITDLSYSALAVADGGAAQSAYLEATSPETSEQRRTELARNLEEYCALDTMAMIRLAKKLAGT